MLLLQFEHCNLGQSLSVGDVDQDGSPDLVIGAPFAPSGGVQRGFVVAFPASKDNTGRKLTYLAVISDRKLYCILNAS